MASVVALILPACSDSAAYRGPDYTRSEQESVEPDHSAVVEAAEQAAREDIEGTSYADQGYPYGCTEDCSGHDAGFEWAEENEITDPDEYGGNSLSFEEGCRARAEAYEEAYEVALEEAEREALAELE